MEKHVLKNSTLEIQNRNAQRGSLSDFLDLCACSQGMAHHTDDHVEAIRAFMEKRPGIYIGT